MVKHVIQIKSRITTNVNVYIYLSIYIYIYICTCNCKQNGKQNDKYLESIIGDFEITCDQIIRAKKAFTTNLTKNKGTGKKFLYLLTFSLISISLFVFGSIYWYLII